jgi:molybdopterin synthase sulfur carrier subunit
VADVTVQTGSSVQVTVRYFAAAQAAVGCDSAQLTLPAGTTIGELVDTLGADTPELATLLMRCSFLCDGVAVRDRMQPLRPGDTIDVLPPFAGG